MRSHTLTLIEWTDVVHIIRYREDVAQLRSHLEREGFRVEISEGPYTAEQLTYSPSVQCLVNHAAAWAKIKASGRPAIVVEPDFVPVRAFGKQLAPMPSDPEYECVGMAWLYACGPIVYGADKYGFIHGHASSVAGCLITPKAASALLDFFARAMNRDAPGAYWPWDTELGVFLRRERHIYNYLPYYHLGEHGSDSRAEHSENGMKKIGIKPTSWPDDSRFCQSTRTDRGFVCCATAYGRTYGDGLGCYVCGTFIRAITTGKPLFRDFACLWRRC